MTRVEIPTRKWVGQRCVLLGSCFSQYMGDFMNEAHIPVLYNPLGTLFNPASIKRLLDAAMHPEVVTSTIFYATADAQWRSWLTDTKTHGETAEECAEMVKERLTLLRKSLSEATHLYLTLGTNVCYQLVDDGSVVTNCHRQPDRIFRPTTLTLPECTAVLHDIVTMVKTLQPDIQVVFTVSPFRYKKYTLHGSQLSKSTLLLAVDDVCRQLPDVCHYFPAYEIMMDELRDYAFYAEDELHPSMKAAEYIWKRLNENQ